MKTRVKSLDILRAVAIFLVLIRHVMHEYPGHNIILKNITHTLIRGGWVGVDLFFVLSGFLISGLLFKEQMKTGKISFKNFFIRRGFKIYPSFYLMIFASLSITNYSSQSFNSELFFMQDYFQGLWNHTWSLGVEEKFYIVLPLLFLGLTKIKRTEQSPFHLLPVIFIIVSSICIILRLINALINPVHDLLTHAFPFHLRMDSLLWGVVISYYYHYHSVEFKKMANQFRYLFLFLGVTLFIPAFMFDLNSTLILTLGFTCLYLGSGFILIAIVDWESKPNLWINTLAYIGTYSYSIYLWHMPVENFWDYYQTLLPKHGVNWYFYIFTYFIGSLLIGIMMSKLVEYPVLRLRDRWFPSKN